VEAPQGELVLEDCHIYSELLAGVMVWRSASNPVLRRCTIHDGYWNGVRVSEEANATLEDCEIFGTVWNGIRVDTRAKSLVRGCKIHDGF
jgi:F-box protein 11